MRDLPRVKYFLSSWELDPKSFTRSNQLLPMPPTTVHDTFDQGETTAFSTLLGVLVIIILLALIFLKGVQSLAFEIERIAVFGF